MTDDPQSRKAKTSLDLEDEQIHWETDLSYGGYLGLDAILGAQKPLSDQHDEMLFIIIHQASELWMKLSLHELQAAMDHIRADDLDPAFKMLSRIARIQGQMIQSWEVLSTLTPADYLKFRDRLGQSSGFQSHQYRMLEFLLGNKNRAAIRVHDNNPEIHRALTDTLNRPSLYDECVRLLARRGFDIPAAVTERDWSEPYEPHEAVKAAWLKVYRAERQYWDLYELAEKLVDLEYHFQQWRFSHMKTVERIIGHKRGTGGSSGVPYLVKALELRFFPELWDVRTDL